MNGLYYYKLVSEYPEDVTKNCKLTISEVDHDLKTLKDYDIKSAEFIRDEKILVLTRNNGERLIVDLSDMVYDLEANANCTDSGVTLTMHYDGKNGVKDIKVDNLITLDMLRNKIEELIGTDILTKVITDGTLKGYGTLDSPLGLNGTEKTGQYAPSAPAAPAPAPLPPHYAAPQQGTIPFQPQVAAQPQAPQAAPIQATQGPEWGDNSDLPF